MKILQTAGWLLLTASLAACSAPREPLVTVMEDGCLSASGDQFILTDLERGEPAAGLEHRPGAESEPTTEAYLLKGDEDELRGLVGKRIRVSGEANPAQVAEIRELSPMVSAGADAAVATSGGGSAPRVGATQEVRFEVHELRVISANPTGDSCQAVLAGR